MPYAIHVGVKFNDVGKLYELFGGRNVAMDFDGWNAWGEKPGEEFNDLDTYHVVIGPWGGHELAHTIAEYLIDLDNEDRSRGESVLAPMGGPERQVGVRVCVSDADQWSEDQTDYR